MSLLLRTAFVAFSRAAPWLFSGPCNIGLLPGSLGVLSDVQHRLREAWIGLLGVLMRLQGAGMSRASPTAARLLKYSRSKMCTSLPFFRVPTSLGLGMPL